VNGLRIQSYGLPECVEKTVEGAHWKERKGMLPKGAAWALFCSH